MKKLLLILTIFSFFGCEPDFDPNADWKALDVIYTVLDPEASEQIVLVNRVFQNQNQNALDLAKVKDSIYHNDSILVRIKNISDDGDFVYLNKTTRKRENGSFLSENHVVYTFDSLMLKIKESTTYRIEVVNSKTGKISFSELETAGEVKVTRPRTNPAEMYLIDGEGGFNEFSISILMHDKKLLYNSILVMPYFTISKITNDTLSLDTLIFTVVSNAVLESDEFDNTEIIEIKGESLIGYIGSGIPEIDVETKKHFIFIPYLEINVFGTEMIEYANAENNFSSLSQTKPFYTNVYSIEDGEKVEQAGLFTSKKTIRKTLLISASTMAFIAEEYPKLGF